MAPERRRAPLRPFLLGRRSAVVLGCVAAALLAALALDLTPAGLWPRGAGLAKAREFFAAALAPDLGATTLRRTAEAAGQTVLFAAAAMGLALVLGIVLGFFASTAWWTGDPAGAPGPWLRFARRAVLPTLYLGSRLLIAFLRSIHELLWALLFLNAIGLNAFAGVVAIAIPYGGTLAKVFSEMVDEAPRDTALALRGAGASALQVFAFGLVPRALPDMGAYAFYRFECALRSSAVLGFFGYPTLGYHIRPAFNEGLYASTWTYLYALFGLVVVSDAWSGRLRRRPVA